MGDLESEATAEQVAATIDDAFLSAFRHMSDEVPLAIARRLLKHYRITPRDDQ